jgi:hypothetical protein
MTGSHRRLGFAASLCEADASLTVLPRGGAAEQRLGGR